MWGGAPFGAVPWGALPIPVVAEPPGPAVPEPVHLGHLDGRAPSPALEGQEQAFAVEGREPALWLPTMRVGG